jgi:hypothetical protein
MSPSERIRINSSSQPSFRHEQVLWINEPGNALIAPLARSRLWAGLIHTLRRPREIDLSLDASAIVEVSQWMWRRRSTRGSAVVADRIELTPESAITVTIEEGPFAGSRSEMRIEEPEPGALLVRIVHEVFGGPSVPLSAEEMRARNAAYDTMNVERICCARRAAESGAHRPASLNS